MSSTINLLKDKGWKKRKYVQSKVQICVDCGSTRTVTNYHSIKCKDCGTVRHFYDT